MADAVSAALGYKKGRWAFINIINALKPVDGCSGTADRPDLGIVASTDPIAPTEPRLISSMVLPPIRNCAKNGNANIPSRFSIMPKGKDSALRPIVCRKLTDKYGLCLNL